MSATTLIWHRAKANPAGASRNGNVDHQRSSNNTFTHRANANHAGANRNFNVNYVDRNVFYHSPPAPRVADRSFTHTNYANAVKAPVGPRYPVSHDERSRNWNSPRGFSPSQGRRVTFSPVQSVKEFHDDSILEKQLVPTPMVCCPVKPVHSPEFDSHIHSTNVVDDEKGWIEVRS